MSGEVLDALEFAEQEESKITAGMARERAKELEFLRRFLDAIKDKHVRNIENPEQDELIRRLVQIRDNASRYFEYFRKAGEEDYVEVIKWIEKIQSIDFDVIAQNLMALGALNKRIGYIKENPGKEIQQFVLVLTAIKNFIEERTLKSISDDKLNGKLQELHTKIQEEIAYLEAHEKVIRSLEAFLEDIRLALKGDWNAFLRDAGKMDNFQTQVVGPLERYQHKELARRFLDEYKKVGAKPKEWSEFVNEMLKMLKKEENIKKIIDGMIALLENTTNTYIREEISEIEEIREKLEESLLDLIAKIEADATEKAKSVQKRLDQVTESKARLADLGEEVMRSDQTVSEIFEQMVQANRYRLQVMWTLANHEIPNQAGGVDVLNWEDERHRRTVLGYVEANLRLLERDRQLSARLRKLFKKIDLIEERRVPEEEIRAHRRLGQLRKKAGVEEQEGTLPQAA